MRATEINISSMEILKPFVVSVWICFAIIIIIIASLLLYVSKWENNEFKMVSQFLLALGAFCQQGWNHNIQLLSTRCLLICLFIAGVLSYNFYTSVLVSYLVNIKYESDINSIDDLMDDDVSIGFADSYTVRYFLSVSLIVKIKFNQ